MSNYSKMQAPPFWMWMFRIAGILCLVTLLTPSFYVLKYAIFDQPSEAKFAANTRESTAVLSAPARISSTDLYIKSAVGTGSSAMRTLAVERLGELAASTQTLVTYPVECLHAKLALEQVASADPDPTLRTIAKTTLLNVAEHGVVISR